MKSKRKWLMFLVLFLSTVLLNSTVHAENIKRGLLHGIEDKLPCPRILLNHTKEFGLTEDQVIKIKDLKYNDKKARIKIHAEIKMLEIELKELLDKQSVDKGDVEEKIENIGKLYIQKAKDCIDNRLSVRKLLTEEQLRKWEEFGVRDYGEGYGFHHGWDEKHEMWEKRGKKKRSGSDTK